mgnify:FL=1|jgi:Na+/H+ antiporter NhaA
MKKLKMKKMRKTVKSKLKDLYVKLSLAVFFIITNLQLAYADEDAATATGADAKYNTVMGFIAGWVVKGGGALIFIGVVEYAYGWVKDRPDAKAQATNFFIGGCIALAAGVGYTMFL